MKTNQILLSFFMLVFLMQLSSCAPAGYESHESGFLAGLIHGFVIIFALIGKLFGMKVGIYAVHNSGFLYWLGFIIGIGGFGSGGGAAARRR